MNDTGNPTENGKKDVDTEVTIAPIVLVLSDSDRPSYLRVDLLLLLLMMLP